MKGSRFSEEQIIAILREQERDEAKADVFDYIERFYNPIRRHSTIGYMSPMDFEMKAGLA